MQDTIFKYHGNTHSCGIRFGIFALVLLLCVLSQPAGAKEYKASLAQMPVYAESLDKGVLVDLVKLLADASGATITPQVVPFARSINDVVTRKVDFHMPLIQPKGQDPAKLEYDYSTETIFHVNFVLYTNKSKPVDVKGLKDLNIETDLAHVNYFDFPIKGSNSIEASLKKIDAGRIDGFIFADFASDPIVKSFDLKTLKRQLYQVFDVKIVLPKGDNGKDVDLFLSDTIKKLRDSGKFATLMNAIDQPYNDWQP